MKLGLPEGYPSPVELPFNRAGLDNHFQIAAPDKEPEAAGVWLVLQGSMLLTTAGSQGPELPAGKSPPLVVETPSLYIGRWDGRPCRLLRISRNQKIPANLQAHSLLEKNPQIPLPLLSLAGVGLMILHWEAASRNCGHCGGTLRHLPAEWGKKCQACNKQHYPQIHPCVIGLVIKGDEILLVRKAEWADGRYGLVAGFVDFGECLEEAMAREVLEETGIVIDNIRYLGSQCWPFPSQLMTGFVADYVSGEINLQEDELEDGGWYKLDQLPIIPPQRSIARYLIDQAGSYLTSEKGCRL
jgi:NAD+ diphosphatase